MPDKFKATWISNSSLSDFLKCPRSYYLRNVYKTKDKRKISIVSPYLSLGIGVHDQLEPLAWVPAAERMAVPFEENFIKEFERLRGKVGGFTSEEQFNDFEGRGLQMLQTVREHPGPIIKPALRLAKTQNDLPWIWLDDKEEIIVCGKVDWIEYVNGLHLIDFKTNRSAAEKDDSLQLPIYQILCKHLKKEPVVAASYWYVAFSEELTPKELPDYQESFDKVLELGLKVKEARKTNKMECPYHGCRNCEPYERILRGEGEFMGFGGYGAESYFLGDKDDDIAY